MSRGRFNPRNWVYGIWVSLNWAWVGLSRGRKVGVCAGEPGAQDNPQVVPFNYSHTLSLIVSFLLLIEKRSNGQAIYRRHVRAKDTLTFILSQRARKAHYLCSETATYASSGKDVKGNNMEHKRKWMITELHIRSID